MKSIGLLFKLLPGSFLSKIKTFSLVFLIVYVLSPIDLVPETIPVIGFLDDVALVIIYFLNRGSKPKGPKPEKTKEVKRRVRSENERIFSPKQIDPHDPYEILGIRAPASQQEIKLAFRSLVKEYHPDLNSRGNDRGDEEQLLKISEAYHRLRKVA